MRSTPSSWLADVIRKAPISPVDAAWGPITRAMVHLLFHDDHQILS
jgi:hypothetical protein